MKNKILLLGALFLILFASCTTKRKFVGYSEELRTRDVNDYHHKYVIYEFESYDLDVNFSYIMKDKRINYDLQGKTGVTNFELKIENLTETPMYVDLSQSSFVKNGRSVSYRSYVNDMSTNFIPPKSYYVLEIPNTFIDAQINQVVEDMKKNEKDRIEYVESNSPLIFRNILTVAKNKELEDSELIDNKFWLSAIRIVNSSDIDNIANTSNKIIVAHNYTTTHSEFYTHKEPEYKEVLVVDGVIVVEVFLLLLGLASVVVASLAAAGAI